jgi:hypothetical protein
VTSAASAAAQLLQSKLYYLSCKNCANSGQGLACQEKCEIGQSLWLLSKAKAKEVAEALRKPSRRDAASALLKAFPGLRCKDCLFALGGKACGKRCGAHRSQWFLSKERAEEIAEDVKRIWRLGAELDRLNAELGSLAAEAAQDS